MIITTYKLTHIEDYEDFLNNLFVGLEYYKKRLPNLLYRLTYDEDCIILTTIRQDVESLN